MATTSKPGRVVAPKAVAAKVLRAAAGKSAAAAGKSAGSAAGKGWSKGVLHSLEASRLACSCLPDAATFASNKQTRELDHILAATFGFWDLVLPPSKKFKPSL